MRPEMMNPVYSWVYEEAQEPGVHPSDWAQNLPMDVTN